MVTVSKSVFYNFLNNKKITRIQGEYFHSEYYIDEEGNKIAYIETLSWSTETIYMIEDNLADNYETLNFIANILNK